MQAWGCQFRYSLKRHLHVLQVTMREVQGGIIASAFFIMFFSVSGLLRAVLRYISPLTVAVNIGIVGLSLYSSGMRYGPA